MFISLETYLKQNYNLKITLSYVAAKYFELL